MNGPRWTIAGQLYRAGLWGFVLHDDTAHPRWEEHGDGYRGWMAPDAFDVIDGDSHFTRLPFNALHRDIPGGVDFRGDGSHGWGYLQIVIAPSGEFYTDIDQWAPIDVVGVLGHLGECLADRWRRRGKDHVRSDS